MMMTYSGYRSRSRPLPAALLGLLLAACGGGAVSGSAVTGVAITGASAAGSVSLVDSSSPAQQRQVATRADGSFSVDVDGLAPPFLLKVEVPAAAGTSKLYAVAEGSENLDVTPITDLAFTYAAGDAGEEVLFQSAGAGQKKEVAVQARAILTDLAVAIAPLLGQYGISNLRTDKVAVRQLLADVTVTKENGLVTIANKRSGGVIHRGPIGNPGSGSFNPGQMPGGNNGSSSGGSSSSGGGSSSSGGSSSGSGGTGNLPANHPAVPSGSTCASCHPGMSGGSSGGSSSGGFPPPPPGSSSSGGSSSSSGSSSSGGFPPPPPGSSSSGGSSSSSGSSSGGFPPPPPGGSSSGGSSSSSSGGSSSGGFPPPPPGSSSSGGSSSSSSGGSSSGGTALDGAALYQAKCAGCHGALSSSNVAGTTAAQTQAKHGSTYGNTAEYEAIANAL